MLLSNPLRRQFPGKKAHLDRNEQALLSWHRPLNLELDG